MSALFCFHNQNNSTSSPGSIPWNMYRCTCIITLVSWCRLRRRRNEIIFFFSCLQLDALRSLKMNSTMNIVNNYRPVQNLGSRKVKPNGKREFVPRDQVFPLIVVYCLLLLLKNKQFHASFIRKNCSGQFMSTYFLS